MAYQLSEFLRLKHFRHNNKHIFECFFDTFSMLFEFLSAVMGSADVAFGGTVESFSISLVTSSMELFSDDWFSLIILRRFRTAFGSPVDFFKLLKRGLLSKSGLCWSIASLFWQFKVVIVRSISFKSSAFSEKWEIFISFKNVLSKTFKLPENPSIGLSIVSWSIQVKPISTFSARSCQLALFSSVPSKSGATHGNVSARTLYNGRQTTSMNPTCIFGSSSFRSLKKDLLRLVGKGFGLLLLPVHHCDWLSIQLQFL